MWGRAGFKMNKNLLKAVIWEGGIFLIVTLLFWVFLGSVLESLILNFMITLIKIGGLYQYNKLWEKIIKP